MLELIEGLKSGFHSNDLKILCLLSPKDKICDSIASEKLLKDDAQIIKFYDSQHEILNDIERDSAISQMKEFINA